MSLSDPYALVLAIYGEEKETLKELQVVDGYKETVSSRQNTAGFLHKCTEKVTACTRLMQVQTKPNSSSEKRYGSQSTTPKQEVFCN